MNEDKNKYKYANLVDELTEVVRILSTSSDLLSSVTSNVNEGLKINNEGYENNTVNQVRQETNDIKNKLTNIISSLKTKT